MKKRLIPLFLILCLLLTGCPPMEETLPLPSRVPELTYIRPDVVGALNVLESSCETAKSGETIHQVLDAINLWYTAVDDFYTNYNLAYINYCRDITDIYWQKEYSFCLEHAGQLDAGTEELFYALAAGPWRKKLEGRQYYGHGFFSAYDGENYYDEGFVALMEEEARLLGEYYSVYEASLAAEPYSEEFFGTYGVQLEEIFLQLVILRQKIAAYVGYDSYALFAYDSYYSRDYSPEDAEAYLSAIPQALSPLYRSVCALSGDEHPEIYDEKETFTYGSSAAYAMGGEIEEAFRFMADNKAYDIAYSEKKLNISFEVYLANYQMPYLFMSPSRTPQDKLAFVHELGHYVNDYLCGGSYTGTDVAEVHSQGMEYLSLLYGQDGSQLTDLKMATCLSVYVDQGAYALFEHQVYGLSEEELTTENIRALYQRIGTEFGFDAWDWDPRDYVCVEHFFSQPMYVVSYVLSNDLAFQIYQKELAAKGEGLALYKECLHSQESYILTFADAFGLADPFSPERLPKIAETLAQTLQ